MIIYGSLLPLLKRTALGGGGGTLIISKNWLNSKPKHHDKLSLAKCVVHSIDCNSVFIRQSHQAGIFIPV